LEVRIPNPNAKSKCNLWGCYNLSIDAMNELTELKHSCTIGPVWCLEIIKNSYVIWKFYCSVILEIVSGNHVLETPGNFWRWPQGVSTFAFQFLNSSHLLPFAHAVTHGTNGHRHGLWPFFTSDARIQPKNSQSHPFPLSASPNATTPQNKKKKWQAVTEEVALVTVLSVSGTPWRAGSRGLCGG